MTNPACSNQPQKLNFGHALVGYNQNSHKWEPVTVNSEGKLLFQQDPDTAQAIDALNSSMESLVEYCHDREEAFGEQINTMLAKHEEFLSQTDELFNNSRLTEQEIQDINNTVWGIEQPQVGE